MPVSVFPPPAERLHRPDGWEESRARLVAFARRRLDDPEDAEDVVHEVFVRALERAESLDDEARLDAWLYQITRNVLIDRHRTRTTAARAIEAFPRDVESRTLVAASDDAAAEVEDARADLARCLRPLIDGLPAKYRGAVSLSDVEGARQKDVAARLGLSVSGAKSRVQRGRRLLRDRLLECCAVERDRSGAVVDWQRRSTEGCAPVDDTGCDSC